MSRWTVLIAAALLASGSPALAAPPPAQASVRVTIVTPGGVPATVTLAGRTRQVAAKPPAGTDFSAAAAGQATGEPGAGAAGQSPGKPVAKALAVSAGCRKGAAGEEIVFDPDLKLGGHFATKVDKYSFLGKDIPTGASVDMGLNVTVGGPARVKVTAGLKCKIEFGEAIRQLSWSPVPMAVSYKAGGEITVGAAMTAENVGLTATAGFDMKGSLSVKNGASFSGQPVLNAAPLEPHVSTNGIVGLKIGGEVILGPGVGTGQAGVIAGVGGTINPVDASFGPVFNPTDSRYNACVEAKIGASFATYLTVKVFLSKWTLSEKVTLDALEGRKEYGGPYYLPKDCKSLPGGPAEPGGPKDSLLGDGVEKVDDATVGAAEQWGHVDGFVPGKKTWVLSTGRMADALGDPGKFASTELGRDGDAELTEFAGHPTYDAASYQVKLIPAGNTLHVRYVFASEEYPEYVGSSFNDVMAVRDGLTKPLTCSVAVTPGQEVTVQIAVADAADQAYDSAIALVDGGIWTD